MGVTIDRTKEGNGPKPVRGQAVTVECTGFVVESGKKFWSTKDPGQKSFTFTIGLGQVIKGWDEGVAQMQVGEHASLTCTPDYGYGAGGFPSWGYPSSSFPFAPSPSYVLLNHSVQSLPMQFSVSTLNSSLPSRSTPLRVQRLSLLRIHLAGSTLSSTKGREWKRVKE